MDNNDILIRLRYALDIKNKDMVEIFKLGGVEVEITDIPRLLTKTDSYEAEDQIECDNRTLAAFLNGFIIFNRGLPKAEQGEAVRPEPPITSKTNMNNLLLKKVKIALSLTTEDMLDIFKDGDIKVTKGELGALLRREGHKNYKQCGENFGRKFLKGLAVRYRS
ncbi:DUF1456 family protein [Bacillus weihaiensis]|uniref:DUF1456 family protein n=1 Tax=Bacillus weihaiensis TaxID=1547283 RepID=UPI00235694E4|nr:DUF1456 family protein [Bacillus weihaiensis]